MSSAFNIPAGFALVPLEPTVAMKRAGLAERHDDLSASIYKAMLAAAPTPPVDAVPAEPVAPIDMVLHCPACGLQHVDAEGVDEACEDAYWANPPHRSHLCHGCGHIWRPADVPTNGVAAVKTSGKSDSPIAAPQVVPAEAVGTVIRTAGKYHTGTYCAEVETLRDLPRGTKVYAASVASRAGTEPVAWEVLTLGEWRPTRFPDELRAKGYQVRIALPDRERAASLVAGEDTRRLDFLQAWADKSIAQGFKWDNYVFTNDVPIREQLDTARASAGEAQS